MISIRELLTFRYVGIFYYLTSQTFAKKVTQAQANLMYNFYSTYFDIEEDVFLKALGELLDIDMLDIKYYYNSRLWFSFSEVLGILYPDISEDFDRIQRCFRPLIRKENIPSKGGLSICHNVHQFSVPQILRYKGR